MEGGLKMHSTNSDAPTASTGILSIKSRNHEYITICLILTV